MQNSIILSFLKFFKRVQNFNMYFYCLLLIQVLITYVKSEENSNTPLESSMLNYGTRLARLGFKKEWIPVTFCASGMPVLRNKVCNGKVDCHDGSDETPELCKSYRCKSDQFRCDYGGCISREFICDSVYNCADGSDEKRSTCTMNNCVLPQSTKNAVYFVPECKECRAGSRVQEGLMLHYQCINSAQHDMELHDIICRSGKWVPFVPKCNENEPVVTEQGVKKQEANSAAVTEDASSTKIEAKTTAAAATTAAAGAAATTAAAGAAATTAATTTVAARIA